MPWSERCRMRSLYEQLAATAGRFPERPAITFQLRSGPRRQGGDAELGGVPAGGDAGRQPVPPARHRARATPSPTSCRTGVEAPLTLLAGATAGIVNPVNPLLSPEHIASILSDTRAKVVVTLAPFPKTDLAQKVAEAVALAPGVETVLQVDLTRYLAPPLAWIVPLIRPRMKATHRAQVLDFAKALARERGEALDFAETFDDRVCAYFHTGGTTGLPKVAQHRARGILYNGWCGQFYIVHGSGRDDVPAADVPCLRRLPDPDVVPGVGGAGGHADAAGLSRRRGDGQLLEADRAATRSRS